MPPSELELIRHQLSISYGKQVQLIKESTPEFMQVVVEDGTDGEVLVLFNYI